MSDAATTERKPILTFTPCTQVCTCCGETKPLSAFYAQSITGLPSAQCKDCVNIKRSVVRNKRKHNKFVSKEKCRTGDIPELSLNDWKACMVYFHGSCAYCGMPEGRAAEAKLDRDHLVPVSKGGQTVKSNIVPACRKCNRGRGNRDWELWFKAQKFYTAGQWRRIAEWQKGTDDKQKEDKQKES